MELITFKNIVKVYPPNVVALDNVSIGIQPGEIHAVVGENGAGKSTLMKVLYGLVVRDGGEILYKEKLINFHSPGEAIAAGIGMVHQEFVLIPEYRVWENVVLGIEPAGPLGRLEAAQARRQVGEKIEEYRFNLDPEARVGEISIAARQKVEILKLLYRDVSVLILDEPTAALGVEQTHQVKELILRLPEQGLGVVVISHNLVDVFDVSDRIIVLRLGRRVSTFQTHVANQEQVVAAITGAVFGEAKREDQKENGQKEA